MLRFSAILLTPLRGVRPLREFWKMDEMSQVLSDPAALPRPGSPERPRTSVSTEAAEHRPQGRYCLLPARYWERDIITTNCWILFQLFQLFQLIS